MQIILSLAVFGVAIWQWVVIKHDNYSPCLYGEDGDPTLVSIVGQMTMMFQI